MRELLDIWDPATHRALSRAMDEGRMTYDELNAVLPTYEVTNCEIEATFGQLEAMGITVYEPELPDADLRFVRSIRAAVAKGWHFQLSAYGWAQFMRGVKREKELEQAGRAEPLATRS